MLNVLAFDYGASSGRGIIGSYNGEKLELKEIHRFANNPVMIGNDFHWDILRLFYEMKEGIGKASLETHEISSIGIDTWGVDFGLLDRRGRLLTNPYHYRDNRTKGMLQASSKILPLRSIYEETGIQLQAYNSLYQLLALKEKDYILDQASTLLFMPDLLRYFLTGEKSNEYSIASTSQLINSISGDWSKNIIDSFKLPKEIFPPIIKPGSIAGKLSYEISKELRVKEIPIVAVAEHDTASAVLAVPIFTQRAAYLSSGTWSLLGIETSEPIINDKAYSLNYTNEGGYNKTIRFLKNIMGLWIYQECIRTWTKEGEKISFEALEEGAKASEPFRSFIDPDDISFYLPGDMPRKIQEYCVKTGQKVPESKAQITLCIMESLALKYRLALEGLEEIIGYSLDTLHIVGGGCKNKLLSQLTANATKKHVLAGPAEATAIGNLMAQLIAIGEVKDINEGRLIIKNSFQVAEFNPLETKSWDLAYERFLNYIN